MFRLFDESTLCFAAALVATVVGLVASLRARRNPADWSFVAGIYLLALDRFFAGLSLVSETVGAVERWQQWRLTIVSVAPGVWLIFSLTYARLNAPGFLRSWRWLWPAAGRRGCTLGVTTSRTGQLPPGSRTPGLPSRRSAGTGK
ncbi:MAG: hypothetical protein ACKOUK_14740, partial [Verrucomicrobiota bacterium]